MNALATLLLITALSFPTPALILRSGTQIAVDDSVTIDGARVVFRSHGRLFSIPAAEVDLEASRAAGVKTPTVYAQLPNRLKVTPEQRDRLIHELEQNHSGTPAHVVDVPAMSYEEASATRQRATEDEWSWKLQAQAKQEAIRRAQEQLDLLRNREEELESQIRSWLGLGYRPAQFTYASTQLQYTRDAIPGAELAVTQAERDYEQFRDNARRMDIMPGWLR